MSGAVFDRLADSKEHRIVTSKGHLEGMESQELTSEGRPNAISLTRASNAFLYLVDVIGCEEWTVTEGENPKS
jgi:hypothetical protein